MSSTPKKPYTNWAAGKPNPQLQLSQRVKSIILAKVAELRTEREAITDKEGGQADD